MTPAAMEKLLQRHTAPRFGHYVNAHLFRDCVASSVAHDYPGHIRIAADLLGHDELRTTERNYIVANQRQALRKVAAQIEQHRRQPKRSAPTSRGGKH